MKNAKLQTSDNYKLFLMSDLNRSVDTESKHYRRVLDSMRKYGFIPAYPVHCKTKGNRLEIFDGQHRFHAARELKLPIHYVVYDNGEIDLGGINSTQAPWTIRNYVESHAQQGKAAYRELLQFADAHKLPLSICANLLAGLTGKAGTGSRGPLCDGRFQIRNRNLAETVATICAEVRKLSRIGTQTLFVNAISRAVHVKEFDPARFMEKAAKYPAMLTPQANLESYNQLIQNIYNHAARNTIPLAFMANEAMKAKCGRSLDEYQK